MELAIVSCVPMHSVQCCLFFPLVKSADLRLIMCAMSMHIVGVSQAVGNKEEKNVACSSYALKMPCIV